MTSLPAERFGFANRGRIQEGFYADLVLFDPETVLDTATYSNPVRSASGIDAVWVNGTLSYHNGKPTQDRAGRFLRRKDFREELTPKGTVWKRFVMSLSNSL